MDTHSVDEADVAFVRLGALLARGVPEVAAELRIFVTDRPLYDTTYAPVDAAARWSLQPPDKLQAIVAEHLEAIAEYPILPFIYSLNRNNRLVYADGATGSDEVLVQLDQIAEGSLSGSDGFDDLLTALRDSAVGNDLEPKLADNLNEFLLSAGFMLESIYEESDSYPLVLVPADQIDLAYKLADDSGVTLYLRHWRAINADRAAQPVRIPTFMDRMRSRLAR